MKHSKILNTLDEFTEAVETRELLSPAKPFERELLSKSETQSRVERAKGDYFFFDSTYFPASMYTDGLFAIGDFHRELHNISKKGELHLIAAPREHGKTATFKKILIHKLLSEDNFNFLGVLSENLPQARRIMSSIGFLIFDNPRIMHDFNPDFKQFNGDNITFRLPKTPRSKSLIPLSEGRSARGATLGFDRLDAIIVDDFITNTSSLTEEGVANQRAIINEAFGSIKKENGSMWILANNFDSRCYYNQIITENKAGILPAHYHVHIYPAWHNNTPLWFERYPAHSEDELRGMLKPSDEEDWNGNYMQDPQPSKGNIYSSQPQFYESLPEDAAGIIYCDPNLSLLSKGDTAAVGVLMFSGSTQKFYLTDCVCRSISDSNDLLDAIVELRRRNGFNRLHLLCFDGNVNQESTWSNNVRNWQRINNLPYPKIDYIRGNVDNFTKNSGQIWNSGDVLCSEHFRCNDEGKRFIQQMLRFKGKKNKTIGQKIDAGDCFTWLIELMFRHRYNRRKAGNKKANNFAVPSRYRKL